MQNQLDYLLEKIDASMHSHPEQALLVCQEVFEQSRSLRDSKAFVVAAEKYGLIMDHLGRNVEARDVLFAAQQAAQSELLFADEAILLEEIARGYYTAGQYRLAIQYWARCIEVSDQAGRDARTWILAKIGLSQVYFGLGDYHSGLALLEEAESRIREVDDPHLDAKIRINLGVNLAELKRTKDAHAAFTQARDLCLRHDFHDYTAEASFRLGQVELEEGQLDGSMVHLRTALDYARRVNYRWCEAQILATQAEIHFRNGDLQSAREAIQVAQGIALADSFRHMFVKQCFAASRYAEAAGDTARALEEFRRGHECEQQILSESASTHNRELEEKAGLRPSVTRLLVDLSNNRLIDEGQLDPAFRLITQEGSRILDLQRASVWMLDHQTNTLVCRCMYSSEDSRFGSAQPLRRQDYPTYFARISEPNPLIAHDALHHPHTWELEHTYLRPNNVRSILAFPIRVAAQSAGLMCFEAVGSQRNWTPDDIAHGNQLAEVAARVLAGYERKLLQQEIHALNTQLLQANDTLKSRVIERTAALERHNAELHALNEKVYEMKRQALQVKQLASFDRVMMSGMAEIDAGLTRVNGSIEDRKKSAGSDASLGGIQEEIAHLKDLSSRIGTFSAVEDLELRSVDLHAVINSVVELAFIVLHKDVRIVREFSDLPAIECRPAQIRQLLFQLLVNAGEALPGGKGEIRIATMSSGGEVSIVVTDNGCGILEKHSGKLFDPLFTTKQEGTARGLGLALCHQIIQGHRGYIDVDSKEGKGSAFTVRIPVKQNR